jgi:hypothetical protein
MGTGSSELGFIPWRDHSPVDGTAMAFVPQAM